MLGRADISTKHLSKNAFTLRPRERGLEVKESMRKGLEFSAKIDSYKKLTSGDYDAKMTAMARRRPVAFAKNLAYLAKAEPSLYRNYRDAAIKTLTPDQLGGLAKELGKTRDPVLARVKADLGHTLIAKARKAPRGPLPMSHHRKAPTGPTQQQLSKAAVSLMSDPAVSKYSSQYYQGQFQKDLAFLIKTDRPMAERWVNGLIESSAKDYAAALGRGDMKAAKVAARQIGTVIGETEQAVRGAISDPKDRISMFTNILEGTTKILGLAFPAHKALFTAFEAGLKFGKAAFKPSWSKEKQLKHFATKMFELTMVAYEAKLDPSGTKRASHDSTYGQSTRKFLDDIVSYYKDNGGRSDIEVDIFKR